MSMSPSVGSTTAADPRWVVLLAVVLFGCNLWGYDLWAPDEPYFGEGAREMIVDGAWLVPHVNGEVTTDKPPLFFWLIALFSWPFGAVSSLTARLPSFLAALGTLLLTLRLGQRCFGVRSAVLAGALLVTSHIFWEKARMAQIDSLLCFLILSALSAFEAFRSGRLDGRTAGRLFWSLAALAVLAKGPVGLLLPLGIAVVTLLTDGALGRWRSFAPVSGPLAFVAISGLWIAAVTFWATDYSVWGALREHFVDRAIHGMHHEQPPWYYLKVLPYALLPWSFLLPGALILAWRRRRLAADRFLLVASLFVVVFFSISTEKRDLYILPALPFFALLLSRLIAAALRWREAVDEAARVVGPRWVTVPLGAVGGLLVLAGAAAVAGAPRFGPAVIAPAAMLAVALAVGGLMVVTAALRGRALPTVRRTGATMAVVLLVAVIALYPALDPQKSGRELAVQIRRSVERPDGSAHPVLGLELANIPRAVNFYSDGVYLDLVTQEELLARLSAENPVYVLADRTALPELAAEHRRRMETVYATRLSRRDLLFLRFGS